MARPVEKFKEGLAPVVMTSEVRDISVTERNEFKSCRRKWMLGTIENLEPKRPTWAFKFGTGIHAALEALYKHRMAASKKDLDKELAIMLDAFEAWHKDTEKSIKKDMKGLEASFKDEALDELWEYKILGEQMIANYLAFDEAKRQKFTVRAVEGEGIAGLRRARPKGYKAGTEVLLSEHGRFMVPIVNPDTKEPLLIDGQPVYLTARLDLLVDRPKPHTGLWLIDHKTTGQAPSDRGLDFDDQITGYCYVVWRLTGIVPRGVIFNYLVKRVPEGPRRLKSGALSTAKDQACLPSQYREALIEEGIMVKGRIRDEKYEACYNALLSKGWDPYFKRLEPRRNKAEIFNFERRLFTEAQEMRLVLDNEDLQYPHLSSWHCAGCQVNQICHAMEDGSDPQSIIGSLFQDAGDRKAEN